MIKPFLDNQFLLESEVASQLYHDHASTLPIVDYHNHLSPKDIAENRKFANITEAWLEGDHYKWRAMRINGVAEKFCTGNASPSEKFNAWAKTVPATLRNPLYHWTHLELKRHFGIDTLLNENSATDIYNTCSSLLQRDDFSVQGLLAKMNVQVVCTTDDPTDSLEYHEKFAKQSTTLKMFPSFRPDKAYLADDPETYNRYLDRLSEVARMPVRVWEDLLAALRTRMDFFNSLGCRSADHGPDFLSFNGDAEKEGRVAFRKARAGHRLTPDEKTQLRAAVLAALCRQYHEVGWVQQFHIGALRGNNSRMAKLIGPDSGFDSVGGFSHALSMSKFLDHLDSTNQLAKTILYNSNPSDNGIFATMAGNFCDGSVAGKIQFGAGWWFLDQKDGMQQQLNALSAMGLLSRFVGMVTDSRSFLSFPRHEYFRRILCNLIGGDVGRGELPDDRKLLGKLVQDIGYFNTKEYFNF
jgi:glucuronate isomerase